MSESVLLAYVEDAPGPFSADAGQLVAIRDAGVPQVVIAAMLRHPSNRGVRVHQTPLTTIAETNFMTTNVVNTNALIVTQAAPVVLQQPVVVQQPTVVTDPPQPVQYSEVLDPYGSWVEVPGYGLCWQPSVSIRDRSWRPYHSNGRWIHSDHGWYWLSNYSWGWVPFHYGRWVDNNRYGWVWIPGSDWGPAWVSWRYGRSHVGWAPLPPHADYRPYRGFRNRGSRVSVRFEWGLGYNDYTFCPIDRFYSVNPYPYYYGRTRNQFIYSQTTVVNNFNQQASANPSNNGVSVNEVQQASRTVVQKVRVVNQNPGSRIPVRPNRVVQSGDSLAIYRQSIAPVPAQEMIANTTGGRSAAPVKTVNPRSNSNRSSSPSRSLTTTGSRSVTSRPSSSSRSNSSSSRTVIRPREPVKSRTIFVEQVPVIRRPSSRPTPVSSSYTSTPSRSRSSSSRSSTPSTRVSTPAPTPARQPVVIKTPEPVVSTPSTSSSRRTSSPSRSSSGRSVTRTPVRVFTPAPTPAPAPIRVSTPKPVVTRPTPAPAPVRFTAPKPVVSTPTPAPRPVVAPRPVSRPTPRPAPAPVTVTRSAPVVSRSTPAPARAPARTPTSSSSSSSSSKKDDSSGRPSARPQRK
ncbi:MAG: DUF6600 domain-containing protein [Limisphaerales bacterium]